ncbi:DUF5591 domain-containing protein [Paramaledivibacter caminithermalis]|jgi:predicted RNA-binding protein|uniref:DUF5591 domain-containing protein n=1 Tax=Paramaledivibacter caminithermalis (strain DSM 15212 / CIP 107654 / DViRD3) TaxID=1121301 RepID=A0A1M6QZZ9_PARC5|nr:DUF5591 domain-containing protein [Paramaledivibacter caminithermalis]SHK25802.1 hypothetical protein SAMN02745912_02796 [Paramaledivibacter caminithermalis DSM 15212]
MRQYPNFKEYILLENTPFTEVKYRRGVTKEFIRNEEYDWWENFFCSDSYEVPQGKDVLFLQPCTWSKPYDFSYIGYKIRAVTNKYKKLHPVILSSSGLVPYEYQMNKTFCAYDFNLNFINEKDRKKHILDYYNKELIRRIIRYIESNKEKYKKVVAFFIINKKSNLFSALNKVCRENNIELYLIFDNNLINSLKSKLYELRDPGELYIQPKVLDHLNEKLSKIIKEI